MQYTRTSMENLRGRGIYAALLLPTADATKAPCQKPQQALIQWKLSGTVGRVGAGNLCCFWLQQRIDPPQSYHEQGPRFHQVQLTMQSLDRDFSCFWIHWCIWLTPEKRLESHKAKPRQQGSLSWLNHRVLNGGKSTTQHSGLPGGMCHRTQATQRTQGPHQKHTLRDRHLLPHPKDSPACQVQYSCRALQKMLWARSEIWRGEGH